MGKRRFRNTPHAEGMHGPRTHERHIEQLESGPSGIPLESRLDSDRMLAAHEGKRRLVEDRQQHDEAEKNSERTELFERIHDGTAEGPSDNSGNLHGVIGSRSHRADYEQRDPDGISRG